MVQVGGGSNPECKAGGMEAPVMGRLSAHSDITKDGLHQVSLDSVLSIVISVSHFWGGGKVTVPSNLVNARFTIENEATGAKGSSLKFQITSIDATVKSFSYPRKVITGKNSFQIAKEKSFVRIYGSRGIVKLKGKAEATLTNRLFSRDNPAKVRISFQGEYNFSTKTAILTKIEAQASSPKESK